jgi:hypothetical protein
MGDVKSNPEVVVNGGGRREGGFERVEGGTRSSFGRLVPPSLPSPTGPWA